MHTSQDEVVGSISVGDVNNPTNPVLGHATMLANARSDRVSHRGMLRLLTHDTGSKAYISGSWILKIPHQVMCGGLEAYDLKTISWWRLTDC